MKTVPFIKDETLIRKKVAQENFNNYGIKVDKAQEEEKVIEILARGPTKEDYDKNNVLLKDITLESMKMGDVFPAYFAIVGFSNENENLSFVADSPCELISMKLSDLQEGVPVIKDLFRLLTNFYNSLLSLILMTNS